MLYEVITGTRVRAPHRYAYLHVYTRIHTEDRRLTRAHPLVGRQHRIIYTIVLYIIVYSI